MALDGQPRDSSESGVEGELMPPGQDPRGPRGCLMSTPSVPKLRGGPICEHLPYARRGRRDSGKGSETVGLCWA